MAKIRSPFDEPVRVPWLGDRVVEPDQVVPCPDKYVANFVAAGWHVVDPPAEAVADPPAVVTDPPAVEQPARRRAGRTTQEG
jgi:hypothetical protein